MPKTKKKPDSGDSDSDSGPEDRNPVKKSKSSSSSNDGAGSSARVDGAKEPTWAIEKMRYVKIREFKGKLYVDIREFYEKDGDELPGKKGISLTAAQFQKLKAIIPEVDAELKKM